MDRLKRLIQIIFIGFSISTFEHSVEAKSGIDLINQKIQIPHQRGSGALSCIVHIAQKYLLREKTNVGSIIVINSPHIPYSINSDLFTNKLVKMMTEKSNYDTNIVSKSVHSERKESGRGFGYRCTNYFLCLTATWELELSIRYENLPLGGCDEKKRVGF